MKNDFAKNFFRNLRMCKLLANGIAKDFLYDVYALKYLINMEEQAKSFWSVIFLRWLFINSSQWHKIINTTQLHYICIWAGTYNYEKLWRIYA